MRVTGIEPAHHKGYVGLNHARLPSSATPARYEVVKLPGEDSNFQHSVSGTDVLPLNYPARCIHFQLRFFLMSQMVQ